MLFESIIKPNDLVFDIGANFGKKSIIFRSLGAKVICIEPQYFCCQQLNNLGFTTEQVIVSDYIGISEFYIGQDPQLSTSLKSFIDTCGKERFFWMHWSDKQYLACTTLDYLIEKYGMPNFCKIDVEGAEYKVINGLSQAIPQLSLEFTPELHKSNTALCIDRLNQLGDYEFNFSEAESHEFKYKENISSDILLEYLNSINDYKVMYGDIYAMLRRK